MRTLGNAHLEPQTQFISPRIEIYVGALIEHESERQVFDSVLRHFTASQTDAIILANFNVGGRQLDLVVATQRRTLLIEVKGYTRTVRGTDNGAWEIKTASGSWKKTRNPYLQALEAKNALRDEMAVHLRAEVSYPDASVVISPVIPKESAVGQGDFKVAIAGHDALDDQLSMKSKEVWTLDQVRHLANALRLERIDNPAAAYSPLLADAERVIRRYSDSFRATFAPNVAALVADTFVLHGNELKADQVIDLVIDGSIDLLIQGPSGCGKTLFATQACVSFLEKRGLPILLQAKNFEGSLGSLLSREVALLDTPSAAVLLRSARTLNVPLLLVADGYNECSESERVTLTRSLRAIANRYAVQIVVTSQYQLERADLLNLELVVGSEPSLELKTAIANKASHSGLNQHLLPLLNSITTGLEADLVGHIGASARGGMSRYALFDIFTRSRLGELGGEGIRLLTRVAHTLLSRLSFSLSIRDLDRIADSVRLQNEVVRLVIDAKLLLKRGDLVSFSHELFLEAFASEAVVRDANGDASRILDALLMPKYHGCRSMIVGAVDDEALLKTILSSLCDSDLLLACWKGECGSVAKTWVSERCREIIESSVKEAAEVRFFINEEGWMGLRVVPDSCFPWTSQDGAMSVVIATAISRGDFFDTFLDALATMDASLVRNHKNLLEEAREKNLSLRSGLFSSAYVFGNSERAMVSRISTTLHSGLYGRTEEAEDKLIHLLEAAWKRGPTAGQAYFLLMLSHRHPSCSALLEPYLVDFLGDRWRFHPYHLKLDLLDAVPLARKMSELTRSEIVAALESLLPQENGFFPGLIFEALGALGAVQESHDEHFSVVRSQLNGVLTNPDWQYPAETAWTIYNCQFDHPFADAYYDCIQELSEEKNKQFLMLACEGSDGSGFFVTSLITELVKFGDPTAAKCLAKWIALPEKKGVMPQEAIAIFLVAHIALGRLDVDLPAIELDPADDSAVALKACAELYYWHARKVVSAEDRDEAYRCIWTVLLQHEKGASASAILACREAMRHGVEHRASEHLSLVMTFPEQALSVFREALRRLDSQVQYFPFGLGHDEHSEAKLAIAGLGTLGDGSDLGVLRSFSNHLNLGADAISAVKAIEGRLNHA